MIGKQQYRVITPADWVHKYQLALDSLRTGVALPDSLKSQCVNILDLHYQILPDKSAKDLSDLLKLHELEPIEGPTKAKTNCQSLVRLINRMIRHYKSQQE